MKRRIVLLFPFALLARFLIAAASPDPDAATAPQKQPDANAAPARGTVPDQVVGPNGASAVLSAAKSPATSPRVAEPELDERDLQFLTAAFEHGQTQLYLGELAKTRADTEQIKAVGVVLSATQAEENKKLVRLAMAKGVTLPRGDATVQKNIAAKLEKLTGPKFEKQLMEEIINVNQRSVANYELASGTHDADIKTFIEQGLPLAKEKLLFTNKMTGTARRSDKQPGFRGNLSTPPEFP